MKNIIKKILKEQVNDKVITKVLSRLEKGLIKAPYYDNLDLIGLTQDEIKAVLEKFIGGKLTYGNGRLVIVQGDNVEYKEYDDKTWVIRKFDRQLTTFMEDSSGYWFKKEFDENGNMTRFENSRGQWSKKEYDENNKLIYIEDSDEGIILDKR